MPRQSGFTLWELLITLLVAGVVCGLGLPSLRWLLLDLQLTSDVNAFVGGIQRARSEAAKRGTLVVMCNSLDGSTCAVGPPDFTAGWIVFVNVDKDRPPVRDADETLLAAHRPGAGVAILGNRSFFELRPFAMRSTNGTVTFCDSRGSAAARAVIVSYTGRPRTVSAAAGASLACA